MRPFGEFNPHTLALRLTHIVSDTRNWEVLQQDFPLLRGMYGTHLRALARIRRLCADMERGAGFRAYAILLGATEKNTRVQGVTTFTQLDVPRFPPEPGVNLAMWLNPSRQASERNVGTGLMPERLRLLCEARQFTGRIWTVIRRENTPSRRVWEQAYGPVVFTPIGDPADYSQVDNQPVLRQLYVSTLTLEQIRPLVDSI